MVIAAIGTVLAAGYLLWMLQRVAFGKVKDEFEDAHIHDVHVPEWIAWAPLLGLILALGVYPNLVFDMTNEAATNVARIFGGGDDVPFLTPHVDYHAILPEIILTVTIVVVLVADLLFEDRQRWQTSRIASIGVLAALVPVLTLAADGANRSMFGGAYVVDNYALASSRASSSSSPTSRC